MTLRLICAGTRDATFADVPVMLAAFRRWIARNGRPTHVVCGANNPDESLGADLIGAHLALRAGVRIDYVPADWARYGKAAGPIRNGLMIDAADGLVVVRHSFSKGSADVLDKAIRKFGLESGRIEDVIVEKRPKVRHMVSLDTKAERKKWRTV